MVWYIFNIINKFNNVKEAINNILDELFVEEDDNLYYYDYMMTKRVPIDVINEIKEYLANYQPIYKSKPDSLTNGIYVQIFENDFILKNIDISKAKSLSCF